MTSSFTPWQMAWGSRVGVAGWAVAAGRPRPIPAARPWLRPLSSASLTCRPRPALLRPPALALSLSPATFQRYKSTSGDDAADSDDEGDDAADAAPKYRNIVVDTFPHHHLVSIGLNRPEKRNCVDTDTADELYRAFHDFENDPEMYCAVLHGVGGNFSAGYDLEEIAKYDEEQLPNRLAAMLDRGPMGPTRMTFTKPVIAAVSGWCVAGGLELALMCDLRVVEETARLGVLCRRFGVPLIDGGTVRLPELIGLSRAMDLILTGRIVEAKEAYSLGIANRLVATGTAYGRAMNIARELTKYPQECMRADRASAYHATFASTELEASLQFEGESAMHVLTKESLQGARKFAIGLGKHGKFNVTPVVEEQDWQKELKEMREEEEQRRKKKQEEKSKKEDDD